MRVCERWLQDRAWIAKNITGGASVLICMALVFVVKRRRNHFEARALGYQQNVDVSEVIFMMSCIPSIVML